MKFLSIPIILIILSSCATFYQANYEFNRSVELGNIDNAYNALLENRKAMKRKAKFLYHANRGLLLFLQGEYERSNQVLEKAYILGEDYQKNYLDVTASFLTNPNRIEYAGEDHEHLLLLYYKALNYLKLENYVSALVECRRLNLRLQSLSEKYKSEKRYSQDAFIHNLMGIIYDASGDKSNAYVAYKNAVEIYETDYQSFFNLQVPLQLKKDLLRVAYLNGFDSDLEYFEQKFELKHQPSESKGGELIYFWHNGLSPIKAEWSVNFVTSESGGGGVIFANDELGLQFPFFNQNSNTSNSDISDLEVFRVAFPKYVERKPLFDQAMIELNTKTVELEIAEDINAIAFKTLKERMVWEMSKSLLRAALKKSLEEQLEKKNEGLGLALGIFNAVTEKADTRNWQTLPHSIFYARIQLEEGENQVKLNMKNTANSYQKIETFIFEGRPGKTVFHAFQTLY
jgi:hypothetical protein